MTARLEESSNPHDAALQRNSARNILQSLGWKDLSDAAIDKLASRQFRARLKP